MITETESRRPPRRRRTKELGRKRPKTIKHAQKRKQVFQSLSSQKMDRGKDQSSWKGGKKKGLPVKKAVADFPLPRKRVLRHSPRKIKPLTKKGGVPGTPSQGGRPRPLAAPSLSKGEVAPICRLPGKEEGHGQGRPVSSRKKEPRSYACG